MDDMQRAGAAKAVSASGIPRSQQIDSRRGADTNRPLALLLFAVALLGLPIWAVYMIAYSVARIMLGPVLWLNRMLYRAHCLWERP